MSVYECLKCEGIWTTDNVAPTCGPCYSKAIGSLRKELKHWVKLTEGLEGRLRESEEFHKEHLERWQEINLDYSNRAEAAEKQVRVLQKGLDYAAKQGFKLR